MMPYDVETVQWSHAQSEGESLSLRCPHCGQEVEVEVTGNEDTDSVPIRFLHAGEDDGEESEK